MVQDAGIHRMVGYELLHSEDNMRVYRYTVENRDDDYGIIAFDLDDESYVPITMKAMSL